MNIKPLVIRALEFNTLLHRPYLLGQLRKLTLKPRHGGKSGLNRELDRMLKDAETRIVNCQILLAYHLQDLVGWSIVSREDTDYCFSFSSESFEGQGGYLFQVFIDPEYRRQGVATRLFKKAKEIAGEELLHVCPWDDTSRGFYKKNETEKDKWI